MNANEVAEQALRVSFGLDRERANAVKEKNDAGKMTPERDDRDKIEQRRVAFLNAIFASDKKKAISLAGSMTNGNEIVAAAKCVEESLGTRTCK